jgi:hypothetical protein
VLPFALSLLAIEALAHADYRNKQLLECVCSGIECRYSSIVVLALSTIMNSGCVSSIRGIFLDTID